MNETARARDRDHDYPKPIRWGRLYDRHFPSHTDPMSRHVKAISESLRHLRSPLRALLADNGWEPDHMASSMERTVKMLWEAREEIARLKAILESKDMG